MTCKISQLGYIIKVMNITQFKQN